MPRTKRQRRCSATCIAVGIVLHNPAALAAPTVWLFDNPKQALQAESGPAELKYFDLKQHYWHHRAVRMSSAERFGLPALPGAASKVLKLPATKPGQGLQLIHHAAANGVLAQAGQLSNYTIVMDVLWPADEAQRNRALLQTALANEDDAELFLDADGRIGINGAYHGRVVAGQWHRLAFTVQAATGTGGVGRIRKFVDGHWVGGHITPGEGRTSRWGVAEYLLLFADNDLETAPLYLAGLMFEPRQMSMQEIADLGGTNGAGPHIAGPRTVNPTAKAQRRVQIAAHRGNSCCAPENTLPALQQALDLGASIIEVDVRLTQDGHAVLMHDESLDRTTNGHGKVTDRTLSALKKLDAGAWFSDDYRGTRIPTLAEAIALCAGRAVLYLDVKDSRLAPAISAALRLSKAAPDAIRVWETQQTELAWEFRRKLPKVPFIWGEPLLDESAYAELAKLNTVGFEVEHTQITPAFISTAHAHNMHVLAFTVHDPDLMHSLIELGVDAIETDYPGELLKLMP